MKRLAGLFAALMLALPATQALGDDDLYQALGEMPGLNALSAEFLDVLLHDPRVSDSFSETDLDRFKEKVALQFCQLTGGPCAYDGLSMAESHAPFEFTNADFNAVVEDLQLAMRRRDISFRTQNKLLKLLAPMQRDIVTK